MPSTAKNPSSVPMWKGVKFSYIIIAGCLFPIAIGGYWAYGNLVILENYSNRINDIRYDHATILNHKPCLNSYRYPQMEGC